jgi:peptidoglycan/xylan/chitin deacetylase (PgdA/CDA1 family)
VNRLPFHAKAVRRETLSDRDIMAYAGSKTPAPAGPGFGAFVLSFDFELHWGVRDHMPPNGRYLQNLVGARLVIPRLLKLFERYDIAATWATVGFLFASSRKELDQFRPATLPAYDNLALAPYAEPTGSDEQEDPIHFAASLVDQIRQTPGQEVATHTFSHYYCLEPGQTLEAFRADLRSAVAIAAERGVALRSIVFPRNQVNPAYASALLDAGISCYRGSENGWMYRPVAQSQNVAAMRAARLADSYFGLPGRQIVNWSEIPQADGLCNVRGSRFLRPYRSKLGPFEKLRLRRIAAEMNIAAESHGVYHLWLHPHNLGRNVEGNLEFFEEILRAYASCRSRFGMCSLSMNSVAELAREQGIPGAGIENEQFMVATHSTPADRVRV